MSDEMTPTEAIVANAEYHGRLLTSISKLDYVASALEHQAAYVADLENQKVQSAEKVLALNKRTKKERKEHETLRDSTARRLAHKLTGRKELYEAKESKEEREYVEALEKEMSERDKHNVIQGLLNEAKLEQEDLSRKAEERRCLHVELDALYTRIFEGPSESFPEEDQLEYAVIEAQQKYEKLQSTLNSESRAAEILARAARTMDACQTNMQQALQLSRNDMWGGGGVFNMSDMMERSALRSAQAYADQAEMLVEQARRASRHVQPVGRVNVSAAQMMTDFFFDNYYSDIQVFNRIKTSAAQVLLANNRIKTEANAAIDRAKVAGTKITSASRKLAHSRNELYHYRRATFESVAAQEAASRPPSYDTVTADPVPTLPASDTPASNSTTPPPAATPRNLAASPAPTYFYNIELNDKTLPDMPLPSPSSDSGASFSSTENTSTLNPSSSAGPSSPLSSWRSRNPYAAALMATQRPQISDK